MTVVERALPDRTHAAPRPRTVRGRVALTVLDRLLGGLRGRTLAIQLPDGASRRYGAGPEETMRIRDWRLLDRLASNPRLGLGESYQAGEWTSDDLVGLLELLLLNAGGAAERHPWWRRFAQARPRVNRRTGLLRARRNIAAHYDLGNDLFALFLDETLTYSCALFETSGEPLEAAQRHKLRAVCDRLELGPDDHVLEIGCGWGSLALTAASEYGARVTAVTISSAQAELARRRVVDAGLDDRVSVVEHDFRELEGSYTKIASIEMLEAVGEKLWRPFFAACDRLLAPGGRVCIQTIVVPDERFARYRSSPDWIERHVFPGCLIPSRAEIARALEPTGLRIESDTEIGPHYAETLRRWRARFHANVDHVRALGYDETFVRTWDFYLASCEALFRTGTMRDAQLVLSR